MTPIRNKVLSAYKALPSEEYYTPEEVAKECGEDAKKVEVCLKALARDGIMDVTESGYKLEKAKSGPIPKKLEFGINKQNVAVRMAIFVKHATKLALSGIKLKISYSEDKETRSDKQNRLSWIWYREIADERGTTPEEQHRHCKLNYGCPILCAEDEDFAKAFRLLEENLSYNELLAYMKYLPVTRIMTQSQMAQYLTDIDRDVGYDGIELTHPVDLYIDALMTELP